MHNVHHRLHARLLVLCGSLAAAARLAAAPYPLVEDFESGLGLWNTNGLWNLTTALSRSPTHAATDSPGQFYTNNSHSALTLASGLDFSGATAPALRFYQRYALESGYDFASIEVSTNGGASWTTLPQARYTGNCGAWTREQIELAPYAGQANVRLRFVLDTDASVVKDGWYLDDLSVGETPAPPTALAAAAVSRTAIGLRWSASASPDLAGYRVLRSAAAGADWRAVRLLAELPATATNYTDIAVAPKSSYFYRVMALNSNELHALSAETSAATPAGMDFPFLDNGEAGENFWIADAPWTLSEETAASPARAWTDSPGGLYSNNLNIALTLAAPIDLRGARAPTLCFNHRYAFLGGDSGNVEISPNGGADWSLLEQYTGGAVTSAWQRKRFSLAAYTNSASVLLRFRLTTDSSGQADGWQIDDISIAEAPDPVPAPVLSEVQSHSLRLTWTACTNEQFAYYAVFRALAPGVHLNSTIVTTLPNRAWTTFVDSGLALDTEYYYRVYAVSPYGTFSPDGTESHARTLNHPLPFADGFEGALDGWNLTGQWNAQTGAGYAGARSLTDSPGTTYLHNQSSWAQTAVDLRGASWPVLRFRDRYELAAGDGLRVGVSADGSSWTYLYGAYEAARTNWAEQAIDLSPWKGQANLRIRLEQWADNNPGTTADGWFIDELSVAEHSPQPVSYPLREGFEGGLTNWLSAGWVWETNAAHAGAGAARDHAAGTRAAPDTQRWLLLAGELNLAGAVDPQLVLWVKSYLTWASWFRVHVSADGGLTWAELAEANENYDANTPWRRKQCSLAAYTNQSLRLRLHVSANYAAPAEDVLVDSLAVEERPPAVTLFPIEAPAIGQLQLTWTPYAGAAFKEYRVYRQLSPGVNEQSTLLATFDDPAVTNLLDSGLEARRMYYYKVWVYNTADVGAPSTESAQRTLGLASGWTDGFETNSPAWTYTGRWTNMPGLGRDGSAALVDSPGEYLPSSDTYAQTALNLSGTAWPVLRFWDRYVLGGGDWLSVEILWNDGAASERVHAVFEHADTNWTQRVIDLSPWKTYSTVWVRFRVATDGSGATLGDGWRLDDMELADLGAEAVYPFYDDFEDGLGHWLTAAWVSDTNTVYSGAAAARDSLAPRLGPDASRRLVLYREIDLTAAVEPSLTLRVKAYLTWASWFRVHVSTDGGVTWGELPAFNINSDANTDWLLRQTPLSAYKGQRIRLRIQSSGIYAVPAEAVYIDGLGIGEPAPGAPGLKRPLAYESVPARRPTLEVWNAVDAQGDPLNYRFEVYGDETLSNLVASVPALASGARSTAWLVDADLANNRQFWWRCRAADASNTGPWMATATFYVNATNHPPAVVLLAGPPPASILHDASYRLSWFPSADPDVGDRVTAYHVQAADNTAFTNPVIDDAGVAVPGSASGGVWTISLPLSSLAGAAGLQNNVHYFWRVRARDAWDAFSAWSSDPAWFIYGTPPPDFRSFAAPDGQSAAFSWERCGKAVYVEFSDSLTATNWQPVAGPLAGTNWTLELPAGRDAGFFRMRVEP